MKEKKGSWMTGSDVLELVLEFKKDFLSDFCFKIIDRNYLVCPETKQIAPQKFVEFQHIDQSVLLSWYPAFSISCICILL